MHALYYIYMIYIVLHCILCSFLYMQPHQLLLFGELCFFLSKNRWWRAMPYHCLQRSTWFMPWCGTWSAGSRGWGWMGWMGWMLSSLTCPAGQLWTSQDREVGNFDRKHTRAIWHQRGNDAFECKQPCISRLESFQELFTASQQHWDGVSSFWALHIGSEGQGFRCFTCLIMSLVFKNLLTWTLLLQSPCTTGWNGAS